jgi:hypothetical protein
MISSSAVSSGSASALLHSLHSDRLIGSGGREDVATVTKQNSTTTVSRSSFSDKPFLPNNGPIVSVTEDINMRSIQPPMQAGEDIYSGEDDDDVLPSMKELDLYEVD